MGSRTSRPGTRRVASWVGRGVLALIALVVGYQLWIFGHILWWRYYNPAETSFMADRMEVLREENPQAQKRHQWVPYEGISRPLKQAVVASEDAKFLNHEGFDWDGIQYAMEKNLKKGRIVAGGSTISQQLAKNLFLNAERTPWRKLQEAIITVMLEGVLSKRRILEIYLNVIEWGRGIFGAEAAARHYYRIGARELNTAQAARLASMIPNPRYYETHQGSQALARKSGIILGRMPSAVVP